MGRPDCSHFMPAEEQRKQFSSYLIADNKSSTLLHPCFMREMCGSLSSRRVGNRKSFWWLSPEVVWTACEHVMCNRWQRQQDPPLCISRGPQHQQAVYRFMVLPITQGVHQRVHSAAGVLHLFEVHVGWYCGLWLFLLSDSKAGNTLRGSNKSRRKEFRESALVVHRQ